MVRASVAAEKAGIRSVSIIARGFVDQARAIAAALGLDNLAIAEYPGVIMQDSEEEFGDKVRNDLVEQIVAGLTTSVQAGPRLEEPGPRDIVLKGTLDQVQDFSHQNLWTDGLPIIPPTIDRVRAFIQFTDRPSNEVVATLPPENREATVWNVAVNGVMGGCKPEYMPILLAVVQAIGEPRFRLEDAGSTPGWEPLIILNGPIIDKLDFNSEAGVMRVGRQANTSVGRFLRLYMRNVAGLRIPPGTGDKGSIGSTFNVVLAENENAIAEIGWTPFSVDRGFEPGENVVTVQSVVAASPPIYTAGQAASEHLQTIAEVWGNGTCASWSFTAMLHGESYPLLVIGPSIAKTLAAQGRNKDDVKRYFYENVRVSAGVVERYARQASSSALNVYALAKDGVLPKEYGLSADPDRPVPVFIRPDGIGIVVAGDPDRNQSRGYVNNAYQGAPVSKMIELNSTWNRKCRASATLRRA